MASGSSKKGSAAATPLKKNEPEVANSSLLDLLPKEYPKVKTERLDDESEVRALAPVFRAWILVGIFMLGFLIRTFSVALGESQIHEFDPHVRVSRLVR